MRFLGLLLVAASIFGFIGATVEIHEGLPKLIADTSLRDAAERCVMDAYFKLLLGLFAVAVGVLFLAIGDTKAEARAVERNFATRVKALETRASALERENAYKDELLGRIQALEGRIGSLPPKS